MYGREGCRRNYRECHPCLRTCGTVEKLCYCKDPGCNSDDRDWGHYWETDPLSDPFVGVNCTELDRHLQYTTEEVSPGRRHDDF